MTNAKSAFQATVWMAIAAGLMLATFEPVSVEGQQPQVAAVSGSLAAA
jgi:hypothetical protein